MGKKAPLGLENRDTFLLAKEGIYLRALGQEKLMADKHKVAEKRPWKETQSALTVRMSCPVNAECLLSCEG